MACDSLDFTPSEIQIESEIDQQLANMRAQLAQQGIPYEEYIKLTGGDEAKMMEEAKEPALRQVRMDLAVAAIIKAENIEVTEDFPRMPYAEAIDRFGSDKPDIRFGFELCDLSVFKDIINNRVSHAELFENFRIC